MTTTFYQWFATIAIAALPARNYACLIVPLKQIGLGVFHYAQDYDEFSPATNFGPDNWHANQNTNYK